MATCAHCEYDRDRFIDEDDFWTVLLNENQATLGRVYFTLKRHETDIARLSADEITSLWRFLAAVKEALDGLFTPDHFNCMFHMNIDPHVHMHLYPRYSRPVTFWGEEFTDSKFGAHYDPQENRPVDKRLQKALVTDLREAVARCR